MNIVSFSGGKDSTAMLLMMIEKRVVIDRIICIDTTKEFPEMYRHIAKVQSIIPIKIEIVKIDFDYWFGEYLITGGKYKGYVGRGWPCFRMRWCTGLKKQIFSHMVCNDSSYNPRIEKRTKIKPVDIIEYHGIAYDEKRRCDNNKGRDIHYPLVEWGITEKQALKYCYSKGFDWGGLYEKFHRVSCWCCPLSRIGEFRTLYNEFPELWAELTEMDKKSFRKFLKNYSVRELKEKFDKENKLLL